MLMISICIFLAGVLLLVFAWSEPAEEEGKGSKLLLPFQKAASLLYRLLRPRSRGYFEGLALSLGKLYPGEKAEERQRKYFIEKTSLVLLVLMAGLLLVIALELKEQGTGLQLSDNKLVRNAAEDGSYTVEMTAKAGDLVLDDLEIEVRQRILSEEEFDESLPEFEDALIAAFLGSNESVESIVESVEFPDSIAGYPYAVSWTSGDWKVINRNGEIAEDLEEETLLFMTAKISYEEYEREFQFPVMVCPKEYSRLDQAKKELLQLLTEKDEETKQEDYLELPVELGETEVVWTKKKSSAALILFLLLLVSAAGIFIGRDKDLEKQGEERTEQMLTDYSEIVSKMTLFVGAGMPVRAAFTRIAREYQEKKKSGRKTAFAYEEMLVTVHEMESGIEEVKAYRNFANRCQVQKYVKFGALLEQNARVGGRDFLENLSAEAKDAFEDKQSRAQQKGEQAGTKLMLPMFLMLGMVLVMIMVPAFLGM